MPIEKITGKKLLEEADGVAIIDEGLLIYYTPDKIDVRAACQYNLILI